MSGRIAPQDVVAALYRAADDDHLPWLDELMIIAGFLRRCPCGATAPADERCDHCGLSDDEPAVLSYFDVYRCEAEATYTVPVLADGLMFACKGFEHRGLHDPAQGIQAEHVLGEEVVLDQPPVLGLILRDDGEVLVVQQRAALSRFAVTHVVGALLPDDVPGHEQPDRGVDGALTATVDLVVRSLGFDLEAYSGGRGILFYPAIDVYGGPSSAIIGFPDSNLTETGHLTCTIPPGYHGSASSYCAR